MIEVAYGSDIIECADSDASCEEFAVRYIARGHSVLRAISLYKLNGSLNWLFCPREGAYFGHTVSIAMEPVRTNHSTNKQIKNLENARSRCTDSESVAARILPKLWGWA